MSRAAASDGATSVRGTAALTALVLLFAVVGIPNCRGGTSLVDPWCTPGAGEESPENDSSCSCCEPGSADEETCGQIPAENPGPQDDNAPTLRSYVVLLPTPVLMSGAAPMAAHWLLVLPKAEPIYLTIASFII